MNQKRFSTPDSHYLYKDNFKPGQDSHRYNMNLNVDSDITNWLTMKVGVKYIRNDSDREGGDPGIYNFGVVPSVYVARQSNGEWGSMAAGRHATGEYMSRNPLRVLSYGDWSHSKTENTMYDLGVDIKPVKGLVISGSGIFKGYEYKNKSFTATRPSINWFDTGEEATGTGNTDNYMSMSWSSTTTMLYTGTARYDWNNDNHEISALVGTSYEHYKYEALGATRQNFPNDQLTDLDSGSKDGDYYGNSAGVTENKMLSYFARINYVLKNRYLFEANMRADASSRFHKDHRWGYFPSFSAGWRISEESFMKGVKWVNNLKLRASYGMLGNINNVGNYDYFYLYASDGSIYNFDEAPVAGVYESKVANSKLGWEKVSLLDVGVDFEIFNGLLNVTADYYVKKTSDILLSYNVAAETGIGVAPSQNLGKVRNNGFEMAITHRNKIGDFSYSVSANISTNSNEITDMGESGEIILNGGANIQFIQRVGESIGSFYGLKSDGLYTQEEIDAGKYYKYGTTIPNAGDIKYVPQRDLEYGESISLDQDRTIIGCDVPSFTYGLNINLQYKNFEFSMFGQGVAGTKVGFGSYGLHPFYHGFDNPREYHLQRWTVDNPNPNAAYPRLYQNGNAHATYNQLFSDFYLFDADYFRFKTLSLGYSVPSNLVNRWGLQTLKVFLTGENLFTIRADKKLKDFDPESASGIISALGIKSFAIGVNVSF